MEEELKGRLLKYLDSVESKVSDATDFVLDQAPALAQEIIRWEIVSNSLCFCIAIAVTLAIFKGQWMLLKWIRACTDAGKISEQDHVRPQVVPDVLGEDCDLEFILPVSLFFPPVIMLAILIPSLCCYPNRILKAAIAPRLVIVEKIGDLVK